MSPRTIDLLKEKIYLNKQHIKFNEDYQDNQWIFTSKNPYKAKYNGKPLHYSVLNNFLNSTETGKKTKTGHIKKVGINIDQRISFNKHISTHIFRHTHVSFLAEQGIPLEVIQERVGHRKGSTVTEIYLHITEKMKDTVAPIIDHLISLADNDS